MPFDIRSGTRLPYYNCDGGIIRQWMRAAYAGPPATAFLNLAQSDASVFGLSYLGSGGFDAAIVTIPRKAVADALARLQSKL